MKKIPKGYIETSATFSLPRMGLYYVPFEEVAHSPQVGDVVYGRVQAIRQHSTLENKVGRIHHIHDNTKALFVFGNRYAPDYYEGVVPEDASSKIDLLARSGMIGTVLNKNDAVQDPTQVRIIGYVTNSSGDIINTTRYSKIKSGESSKVRRNKLILSIGTNMNSGKTTTAAMCCWTLSKAGHSLTASKITGTASLKDILLMQDKGAEKISDFTYFGLPSTYMMPEEELIEMFKKFDAHNNKDYWIVEFADGILQRETNILLLNEYVRSRIHKVIFNAHDTFSAMGGIKVLQEELRYSIDAISGVVSGSPLLMRELSMYSDIPVINNVQPRSFKELLEIIV